MTHAKLEQIIDDLAYRFWQAPSGSAEERPIMRELQGLLPQEMAQPFMEDHGIFMGRRPVQKKPEAASVSKIF
jgi:hypothetical protein